MRLPSLENAAVVMQLMPWSMLRVNNSVPVETPVNWGILRKCFFHF
jgi:hypothetical protein